MDPMEEVVYTKKRRPPVKVNVVASIAHGRSYASTMVSDQETMLAQLRYTRRQMDKDMAELESIKNVIYKHSYPRKWTIPQSYLED